MSFKEKEYFILPLDADGTVVSFLFKKKEGQIKGEMCREGEDESSLEPEGGD